MGLRTRLHSLFGRFAGDDSQAPSPAGAVQSIELPGSADWEQAAALIVAEGGDEHAFALPDDIADETRPLTIQFGGSSDDPNTVVWSDPPAVTASAEILIEDTDGEVRPVPRTERRGG